MFQDDRYNSTEGRIVPSNNFTVDRPAIFVGGSVALLVGAAIVTGLAFLSGNIKSNVASFASNAPKHVTASGGTSLSRPSSTPWTPVGPETNEGESSPSSTPWTRAGAQAYATEQADRAARLRQEEHARQLEETRRANQQIIDERARAQQQRQQESRRATEQDFTVPLGAFTRVTLAGKSYQVAVHDDGPDEIRVLVDYRPVLRFQKHNGFEGHDIETLILSNGNSHLYYVNEISDHVGHCKLRLRDE